jgi:hypothetical protein
MMKMINMETIIVTNGKFQILEKYRLTKNKKRLSYRTPWVSETQRLCKDGRVMVQQWIRHKKLGQKPFIPEGFIEIDGVRYKIEEHPKVKKLNDFMLASLPPSPKVDGIREE